MGAREEGGRVEEEGNESAVQQDLLWPVNYWPLPCVLCAPHWWQLDLLPVKLITNDREVS